VVAALPSVDANRVPCAWRRCGSLVPNGGVYFKSSKGTLGFPQSLANKRFTGVGVPVVVSCSAQ